MVDSLMRACVVEVGDVFLDDAVKMAFAEDEEVVKALAAKTAEESFADGVGFWSPDRCPQNLDMRPHSDTCERSPVPAVIVADEEP